MATTTHKPGYSTTRHEEPKSQATGTSSKTGSAQKHEDPKPVAPPASHVAQVPPERLIRETAERTEAAGKDPDKVMVALVPPGGLFSGEIPAPPDKAEIVKISGKAKGELVAGEGTGTSRVMLKAPADADVTVEVKRK